MIIVRSIKEVRNYVSKARKKNHWVGFVPTMGALHEGHMSLIRRAIKECGFVVVSIFVNPLQFGPRENFGAYPRTLAHDRKILKNLGINVLFCPSGNEMFPEGYKTYVDVKGLGDVLCGKSRPDHFCGVATVVLKLFQNVVPDKAYFGLKDYQQYVIIQQMAEDLNLPIKVHGCPTVREKDGLAMSSRNVNLTKRERLEAPMIYSVLKSAKKEIISGRKNAHYIKSYARRQISEKTSGRIDYFEVLDAGSLKHIKKTIKGRVLIATAVKFKKVRLMDNIIFSLK